jgi:hypothetical protein
MWTLINKLNLLIEKSSGDSLKKKDFFALAFFVEMGLALSLVLELISPMINSSSHMISTMFDIMKNQTAYMVTIPVDFMSDFKFFFVSLLPMLVMVGLMKLNIKRGFMILVCEGIQVILFVLFYRDARLVISIVFVICLLVSVFFPIGTGAYYNLIRYANYLTDIYEHKVWKKKNWKVIIMKFAISCIGFVLAFKLLFPFFSMNLLFLLFAAIVLLLWINASKDESTNNLKKILVYAVFIPFVLLSNNLFELTVQNIVLVIISIFFSLERVINLIKELMKKIENESLRYLVAEINEGDKLLNKRIELNKELKDHISEKLLIRQIVIYFKLGLEETKELIQIYYEKDFKKESMLIGAFDYFLESDQDVTLEKRKQRLEIICNKNEEDTCYIPILEEYAKVLYWLKLDYEKIVILLDEFWLYIEDDSKYVLYYSLLKLNNVEAANNVKREIECFEDEKLKMQYDIE